MIGNGNATIDTRQAYVACLVGTVVWIQAVATDVDIAEGTHRYGAFASYCATFDRYNAKVTRYRHVTRAC